MAKTAANPWDDWKPPGDCPSDVITFFGAQVGWDTARDGLLAGRVPVHCSLCARTFERDADGFLRLVDGGAIDAEPDGIRAVCERCAHSTDDAVLGPERVRSEAEYKEIRKVIVVQSPPSTMAERKAPQLRRAAVRS